MNESLQMIISSTVDFAENNLSRDETPTLRSFTKGLLVGRLQACASIAQDEETQSAVREAEQTIYKLFRQTYEH